MAIPTFIQKSRINQVIYQLRDGQLLISERALLGKFQDRKLDLQWLDPNYQPGFTRNHFALALFLLLTAISGLAVWGIVHQTIIPSGAALYIGQWPAVAFAVFLASAIRWSRRIEYYRFNNRAGHPVLVIIREREQAEECAAFITTLVAHIELAQSDVTPEARTKLLRDLGADRSFAPPATSGLPLWKSAIALGVLAAGLPLIPNLDRNLAGFLFPIVFLCCAGGVAFSFFSFSQKEAHRWWSVIGLVLALIPVFFYS